MPLARLRFTIRRLMVAVAISALGLWVCVRYARGDPFERILITQMIGAFIAFGMMIGGCASLAALIGRVCSPRR